MRRLDTERQERLEPLRLNTAVQEIVKLGYELDEVSDKWIKFTFNGSTITYFPYSGWASGKTIKDGRGLKHLLDQITPEKDPEELRDYCDHCRGINEGPASGTPCPYCKNGIKRKPKEYDHD